jgi:hypothetical protein
MKDTDVTKLRRARSRAHFAFKQAETLAQDCRIKLADLEAHIEAIAPDLQARRVGPAGPNHAAHVRPIPGDPRDGVGRIGSEGYQVPGPADDEADARPIAGGLCEATGPGRGADGRDREGDTAGAGYRFRWSGD